MLKKSLYLFCFVCILLIGCSSLPVNQIAEKELDLKEKDSIPVMIGIEKINLVGIGDSLTKGFGDQKEKDGYIGRVQQYLEENMDIKEVNMENFGVKGHKTTNLIKRLKEDAQLKEELLNADIIFMTVGANDLMAVVKENIFSLTYEPFRAEKELYQKRLLEIITLIRGINPDAHLYFIGLYNPFKSSFPDFPEIDIIIQEWNEVSKTILADDPNATYVPIFDLFSNPQKENVLYTDKFHPNEVGYMYIAKRVYQAIERDRKM